MTEPSNHIFIQQEFQRDYSDQVWLNWHSGVRGECSFVNETKGVDFDNYDKLGACMFDTKLEVLQKMTEAEITHFIKYLSEVEFLDSKFGNYDCQFERTISLHCTLTNVTAELTFNDHLLRYADNVLAAKKDKYTIVSGDDLKGPVEDFVACRIEGSDISYGPIKDISL